MKGHLAGKNPAVQQVFIYGVGMNSCSLDLGKDSQGAGRITYMSKDCKFKPSLHRLDLFTYMSMLKLF